jgi:hypothetical protein
MEAKPHPRSTKQALEEQRRDAEREYQRKLAEKKAAAQPQNRKLQGNSSISIAGGTGVPVPRKAATVAIAVPDNRSPNDKFLDEIAPQSIAGRPMKLDYKSGQFVTADDGEPIPPETIFAALMDESLWGWVRFHEDGPPDKIMGPLCEEDYRPPPRNSLGDTDESQWKPGLNGAPEDPFKLTMYVVLQSVTTQKLYTFITNSKTGRGGVAALSRHYKRLRKTAPDEYPLVVLQAVRKKHQDDRVGFYWVPFFVVRGKVPKSDVTRADASLSSDLDDSLGF